MTLEMASMRAGLYTIGTVSTDSTLPSAGEVNGCVGRGVGDRSNLASASCNAPKKLAHPNVRSWPKAAVRECPETTHSGLNINSFASANRTPCVYYGCLGASRIAGTAVYFVSKAGSFIIGQIVL